MSPFSSFFFSGRGRWLPVTALLLLGLTSCHRHHAPPAPPPSNPGEPTTPAPAAPAFAPSSSAPVTLTPEQQRRESLREIFQLDAQGKLDEAMTKVNAAIQADPKDPNAYILRGDIYSKQKQFDKAMQDYQTVLQVGGPAGVAHFNLAELKFMQKDYDGARPGFVDLQKDPDLGDLASFKVFLCDLLAGHEDVAKKELDGFDNVGGNASYYFANVAWSAVHHNVEDARGWLTSALHIYPPAKIGLYSSSLHDLGYLPLPASSDSSATSSPAASTSTPADVAPAPAPSTDAAVAPASNVAPAAPAIPAVPAGQ